MSPTALFLRVFIIFPLFFSSSTCFGIPREEHLTCPFARYRRPHGRYGRPRSHGSTPAWNIAERRRSRAYQQAAGGGSGVFATRSSHHDIASLAKTNGDLKLVRVDDFGAKGDGRADDTEVLNQTREIIRTYEREPGHHFKWCEYDRLSQKTYVNSGSFVFRRSRKLGRWLVHQREESSWYPTTAFTVSSKSHSRDLANQVSKSRSVHYAISISSGQESARVRGL